MSDAQQLINEMFTRLSDSPFKVFRTVSLPNGPNADITASRTYFSWKGLVILSQHILIQRVDSAALQDMQNLFEAGFRYGKQVNKVPLLRGMQFGYMIIPVIVGENPGQQLCEFAESSPRKHWSLFEYPVVVNSANGKVMNFKGRAAWGAFFFSDMRSTAAKYIE